MGIFYFVKLIDNRYNTKHTGIIIGKANIDRGRAFNKI